MAFTDFNAFPEAPEWLPLMETLASFHASTLDGADIPVARFGFRVGGLGLLLPAGTHGEIVAQPRVNPFPGTQPWFGGLLNLRGHLVPVFDLRRWLGATGPAAPARYLFAIDRGEQAVAVWSDGLPEIRDTPPPSAPPPPVPELLEPYVYGGYALDGQFWLEVQFDALFAALGARIALD